MQVFYKKNVKMKNPPKYYLFYYKLQKIEMPISIYQSQEILCDCVFKKSGKDKIKVSFLDSWI